MLGIRVFALLSCYSNSEAPTGSMVADDADFIRIGPGKPGARRCIRGAGAQGVNPPLIRVICGHDPGGLVRRGGVETFPTDRESRLSANVHQPGAGSLPYAAPSPVAPLVAAHACR